MITEELKTFKWFNRVQSVERLKALEGFEPYWSRRK
jgi:hypothetical protein